MLAADFLQKVSKDISEFRQEEVKLPKPDIPGIVDLFTLDSVSTPSTLARQPFTFQEKSCWDANFKPRDPVDGFGELIEHGTWKSVRHS